MITIERRVGRLMEGRFEGQLTEAHLKDFGAELSRLVVKAGHRLVFVVDWRSCGLIDDGIEARLIGQARSDNFAIERSAFLMAPAGAATAQVEKIVAMGRNPARRGFLLRTELLEWVAPVLQAEELARAQAFFDERPSA